jgi:hypothetical protein
MKGAQFYVRSVLTSCSVTRGVSYMFQMSCAQIRVTEGGSFTPTAMNTVAFPGAYKQNDP